MSAKTVYISYSRQDRHFVLPLVRDLGRAGITVYYDSNILKTGQSWRPTLLTALDRADAVVVVLSENSRQSQGLRDEVGYALRTKKRVLPVMLDGVFDLLNELGLSEIYASQVESSADYAKVIDDIVDVTQPSLTTMSDTLHERGFSDDAVKAFISLARPSYEAPNSALVLHYDQDLELEQIMNVEQALNGLAHIVVTHANTFQEHRSQLLETKIFHLHSVTHPGSTLLEFVVTVATTALIAPFAQEVLKSVLTGLISDAIKDQIKGLLKRKNVVFAKDPDTGAMVEIQDQFTLSLPKNTTVEIERYVKTVITTVKNDSGNNSTVTETMGSPKHLTIKGGSLTALVETSALAPKPDEATLPQNRIEALEALAKKYKSKDV